MKKSKFCSVFCFVILFLGSILCFSTSYAGKDSLLFAPPIEVPNLAGHLPAVNEANQTQNEQVGERVLELLMLLEKNYLTEKDLFEAQNFIVNQNLPANLQVRLIIHIFKIPKKSHLGGEKVLATIKRLLSDEKVLAIIERLLSCQELSLDLRADFAILIIKGKLPLSEKVLAAIEGLLSCQDVPLNLRVSLAMLMIKKNLPLDANALAAIEELLLCQDVPLDLRAKLVEYAIRKDLYLEKLAKAKTEIETLYKDLELNKLMADFRKLILDQSLSVNLRAKIVTHANWENLHSDEKVLAAIEELLLCQNVSLELRISIARHMIQEKFSLSEKVLAAIEGLLLCQDVSLVSRVRFAICLTMNKLPLSEQARGEIRKLIADENLFLTPRVELAIGALYGNLDLGEILAVLQGFIVNPRIFPDGSTRLAINMLQRNLTLDEQGFAMMQTLVNVNHLSVTEEFRERLRNVWMKQKDFSDQEKILVEPNLYFKD